MDVEQAKKFGVEEWSIWESEPQVFEWYYGQQETAFIHEGEVIIRIGDNTVKLTKDMLVSFPRGLTCTWQIISPVKKSYTFNMPF